jgi:hypothetical protein
VDEPSESGDEGPREEQAESNGNDTNAAIVDVVDIRHGRSHSPFTFALSNPVLRAMLRYHNAKFSPHSPDRMRSPRPTLTNTDPFGSFSKTASARASLQRTANSTQRTAHSEQHTADSTQYPAHSGQHTVPTHRTSAQWQRPPPSGPQPHGHACRSLALGNATSTLTQMLRVQHVVRLRRARETGDEDVGTAQELVERGFVVGGVVCRGDGSCAGYEVSAGVRVTCEGGRTSPRNDDEIGQVVKEHYWS